MSDQIKMPKLRNTFLSLTIAAPIIAFTTQALADGGMMGIVNQWDQNVTITCANGKNATLKPEESANCTDKNGLKQSMTVKAKAKETNTYYPGKKIGKSNHIVVDGNGDSYQE